MSKFITSDPPYNPSEYPTNAGFLELAGGVVLSSTLTNVTDQLNRASTLYLSTQQVSIGSVINNYPLALRNVEGFNAIFDTSNISIEDKIFTFPPASLTFAGINIAQDFSGNNIFSGGNIFNGANNFTTTQNFNVPDGTSGTANISIPTVPYSGGGRNANHPTLVLGSVTGSIWGLSGNGTYLGINAPTVFIGNLIDLKFNGTTVLNITQTGALTSTAPGAASKPALSLTGAWLPSICTVTAANGNGTTVTYTSTNNFRVGDVVTITGLTITTGSSLNLTSVSIATASSSNFTVTNSTVGTAAATQTGTATFVGGTSTNYKPQYLIEPTGVTSTNWSTNGTGLGINAASGFTGNLLDLQVGGVSKFKVSNTGSLSSLFVSGTGYFAAGTGQTSGTTYGIQSNLNIVPTAGDAKFRPYEILYTINASGLQGGSATGIFLNATETLLNGMGHDLMNLQTTISSVTTSKFKVANSGVTTYNVTAGTAGIIFDVQIGGVSKLSVTGSNGIIGGTTIGTTNSSIINFYENTFVKTWAVIASTTAKVTFGSAWNNINLPTSRPSIVGDFYVDTAANILANGDKLVAIRQ
jgi:hypothetical protein